MKHFHWTLLGRPAGTEGYGMSNVELQTKVHPETIFQSGSTVSWSTREVAGIRDSDFTVCG
jgi:hypothetical protein